MTNTESIFTVTLNLAAGQYFPVRVSKTGAIPGLTTFEWRKEYDDEDAPVVDGVYSDNVRSTPRNFEDRDLWLSQEEANTLIMDPSAFMPPAMKELFKSRHRDWELFVTEYKPQLAVRYNHTEGEEKRKALRKAALLAAMKPEDRALFK